MEASGIGGQSYIIYFLGEGRLLLDDVVKAGVFLLIYRKLQNYIVIT